MFDRQIEEAIIAFARENLEAIEISVEVNETHDYFLATTERASVLFENDVEVLNDRLSREFGYEGRILTISYTGVSYYNEKKIWRYDDFGTE